VNAFKNEDGALMLMALMVMLLCTIWGIATIELASIEKKLSFYLFQSQQAQQAADGGVEWAIEEIWHRGLPAEFEEEVTISDGIKAQIKVTEKAEEFDCSLVDLESNNDKPQEDELQENEKKKCRYCLTSTAVYNQAKKKLKVKLLYTYTASSPQPYESAVIEYYCLETDS